MAFTYWIRQVGRENLIKVHLADSETVQRLNFQIMDLTGIPPDLQKLVYGSGSDRRRAVELEPLTHMPVRHVINGLY